MMKSYLFFKLIVAVLVVNLVQRPWEINHYINLNRYLLIRNLVDSAPARFFRLSAFFSTSANSVLCSVS